MLQLNDCSWCHAPNVRSWGQHICVTLVIKVALQVRSDCAPQTLQEFLTSDTADEADFTALSLYSQEDEEAALLEEVGCPQHVASPCSHMCIG